MAIPINALGNWYANLTPLRIRNLKSEILGLGRWELGRPVGRRRVPTGFVQPGRHRKLSTMNKMTMP